MNASEFIFKLSNLPENTAITKEHLLTIFEVLKTVEQPVVTEKDALERRAWSQLDPDARINEDLLSEWIGVPTSSLQKWRVNEDGPKFLKKKNVTYRVGDVRDWIKKRTVGSVAEGHMKEAKGWKFISDIGAGHNFNLVIPTIYIDGKPKDFFDTLAVDESEKITGYDLKWIEVGSVAEKFYTMLNQVEAVDLEDELVKLAEADWNLNAVSAIYIGGELRDWYLPHLLASLPTSTSDIYGEQVDALYYAGAEFDHIDEKGLTPEALAEQNGNFMLPEFIGNIRMYEKLSKLTNPKG